MSDIERERIRREAADDVASRPPGGGDTRLQAALRRYLGTSLFTMKTRERSQPSDDAATSGSDPTKRPDDRLQP